MTKIGHVMILASAGSGKTYALTNRFVRLLALGAKPERIVALTFTRKAAGEFFDEILKKLARAASEPEFARRLAQEIEVTDLGTADFLKLLRAVAEGMHRLRLGTFDGFFARIARNFPLELGLAGEFEILQTHAARMERGRVLRRMFQRSGELMDAQKEFIEAFKRATFGADEKRLGTRLDRFIDEHQEVFLSAPDREVWGKVDRIWPEGSEWLGAGADLGDAVKTLRTEVNRMESSEAQQARWNAFFVELADWTPGAPMGAGLEYLFKNALKALPELKEIVVERKKQALPSGAVRALRQVLQGIVGRELARRMETTGGIHAVLRGYETVYHDAVRRAGKLTFGDVQRLLLPGENGSRMLSREAADERRLLIDFRLDAEIDHWLLDEFQDTSFGQWSVLKNLIDEAVQDPSAARSFFYVGDVKQAIFAWREGDPRLFREIFDHYNAAQPGLIAEKHLVKSFRSSPPVIAAVNQVFGDAAVMTELFPGPASEAWNREWRNHESAKPQLGGHVALLQAADEEERFAIALRLLHEIEPLERGLTCALLVQKNDTAARLADYLRREGGVPAVAESDLHVCTDNPLGTALLAFVKAAAYPGDLLAHGHLKMTPLGALLVEEGVVTPEKLTRRVLREIYEEGFEKTLEGWWRKIERRLERDDEFTRERAAQFLTAAGQFDATGSREVAEFIQFMERYTVRESDSAAVVRVMTVHKSKGLGFDLVILPDLEGTKLDARRDGLAVQRAPDRSVEWTLDLPTKLFAENDPVLSAHLRAAEADGCYENLSLLYVAMTRAKRAMYLIAKPPGKSTSRNFPKLLAETLGEETLTVRVGKLELMGGYVAGNSDWHLGVTPPTPSVNMKEAEARLETKPADRSKRLPARKPSEHAQDVADAAQLFAVDGAKRGAIDLGCEVHALLAEVEWIDTEEWARVKTSWSAKGEAGELALACLRAEVLADVWKKRERNMAVWRERAFELVHEGVWVTGVLDRVLVELDERGRPRAARVFDFKTDADESLAADRHREQMSLYRSAVATLAGLDPRAVSCELILVRSGRRLPME